MLQVLSYKQRDNKSDWERNNAYLKENEKYNQYMVNKTKT